ncbi:MAG: UDP-N-acetylmuramoyl-L-alanyl-D-glutamate--2,6-diaminopimelate ligase [Actinomycetia bacterium]|nr:UDP-N-acetylmuramoyl-L-alanyl-D-glutamate--2,6-diaminopimelate ligase [Actinomycetes bacterium]
MRLKDILEGVACKKVYGNTDIHIKDISINSKKIIKGGLFAAVKGFRSDGHDFVGEAVRNGAIAVITNKKMNTDPGIVQIIVEETREILPIISKNFFGDPSKSLKIIGITGTNGKTTTCYIIDSILKSAGLKTSMITTYRSYIDRKEVKLDRTTPESIDLQKFFAESVRSGVQFVSMEVSSHSVDLHRVDHIDFDYLIFTNLTQDHLDYHGTLENYFEVKSRLFNTGNRKLFGSGRAIINIDDSFGRRLFDMTGMERTSYSIDDHGADIRALEIISSISGLKMMVKRDKNRNIRIKTSLCGIFNIYNILAASTACFEAGIDARSIIAGIEKMKGFGGRFEKIENSSGPTVIVDYAHTPDGLENVLSTARDVLAGSGKLISVFGCGGDRDRNKRKIMGGISARLADYTIITSDNPRSEEPDSIISMIEEGFMGKGTDKYCRIIDRKEAILMAIDIARPCDLVLIAGKGHEDYQEFGNGRRVAFCDFDIVREYNENKRKGKKY